MFRLLINNRIFSFLSYFLKIIIKYEIELDDVSQVELKDKNIVFALPVDSVSDLMALAIANKEQQLASPLDKFESNNLEKFICLKDPKYIISEQKIKR